MSEMLKLEEERRDGAVVLTVNGSLDATNSAAFRDRCLALLPESGLGLILDVSGVPFVASSGLGTFLLVSETGRKQGRNVVIAGTTTTVREVLAMMNLVRFLDMQPDVSTALAGLLAEAAPSV